MHDNTDRYDLIVVGGGPGGSAAAAIAARGGARVLLLEAGTHPRHRVGESMLPGIAPILEQMGCLQDVVEGGFELKSGATHWGFGPRNWDLWFRDTDEFDSSFFVERSRFDELLFRAAARAGAEVRQNAPVTEVLEEEGRVCGVRFRGGAARGRLVIDASGSAAVVAKARSTRVHIEGLHHRAHYAFWTSDGRLPAPRSAQAFFVGLDDAWIWCFPISENVRSVGLVELEDAAPYDYEQAVRGSPVGDLLGRDAKITGPVRHARDWSYRSDPVTGPGWMAIGDAAGFVDPILSTGVMLAMHSGWHAARSVLDVLANKKSEEQARNEYAAHHGEFFGDLLRIVRFYYQQNGEDRSLFWESKRILSERITLKPQKAFLVLTSGLVRNLAFGEAKARVTDERLRKALAGELGEDGAHDPDRLSFVCIHLEHAEGAEEADERAQLYLLIEERDPAAPSLFRTAHFDLNCLAPRYDNDPISVPALEPHLRALHAGIRPLDRTEDSGDLSDFWRRERGSIATLLEALPDSLTVRRVFGE